MTATKEEVLPRRVSPRIKRKVNEEVSPEVVKPESKRRKPARKAQEASPSKKRSYSKTEKGSPTSKKAVKRTRTHIYDRLLTRMSPKLIMNLIKMNPSEKQIEAIESMGFGGLLKLQTEEINGHLARWIVETFDPFDCSLMNGKLDITDEDVYLATGLPMGPLDLVQVGSRCKSEGYLEAVRVFREQFTTSPITKKLVLEKMMEQRDGGDDFKRNFLVYIVSVLLMGVVGDYACTRILGSLGDLSDVPKFNWCKFAREQMIDNVISWKEAVVTDPNVYFKGPILIFTIIYLDRVVFKSRKVPRCFPLLANWTEEKIRERVKMEKHEAKGFGKGHVYERFVYESPISDKRVDNGAPTNVEGNDAERNEEDIQLEKKKDCIKHLAGTAISLANTYDAFSKAVRCAKTDVSGVQAVSKMTLLADSLFEGFSLSQQESQKRESERQESERQEGADDVGGDKVEQEKRVEEVKVQHAEEKDVGTVEAEERHDDDKVEEEKAAQKVEVDREDDDFLNNPSVLADLEGILNSAYDHVSRVFSDVGKEKMEKALMEGPSFSLFSGDDAFYTSQEFADLQRKCADVNVPRSDVPHASTSATPFISSPVVQCPISPIVKSSTPVISSLVVPASPIVISSQLSPIFISSQLSSEESPVQVSPPVPSNHPMGTRQPKRAIAKRNVGLPDVYRSPFFIRNVDVLRDLSQSEKEIGDYAFAPDLDEGEVMFSRAGRSLTRCDLKTLLLGGQVHSDVVDVWCDYQNFQNRFRDRVNSPSRLFLTESTDIDSIDVNFTNVKLVFTLVVTPTPLLFCFHVDDSLFEVIFPTVEKETNFSVHVKHVKKLMTKKLSEKIPKVNAVWFSTTKVYIPNSSFDVERDTGIYLMRHMETYNGIKAGYQRKLIHDRHGAKRYIVKVCNQILTWQDNSLNDQVMSPAKAYKNGICNQVPQDGYTDAHLMHFIRTNVADKHDVVVETEWLQVTKEGLRTLLPGTWVMDMVIDLMGLRTSLELQPSVVYFPTIIKDVVWKKGFRSQYIKLDYLPKDLTNTELAFFPFCVDKSHWLACVSDFNQKKNFVLDSNPPRRPERRLQWLAEMLLPALEIIATDRPGYKRLMQIHTFEWERVNVPRQKNGYACGVYLLKWLENVCSESSWTDKTSYENLDQYAESKIVEFMKWEQNKRKVFD